MTDYNTWLQQLAQTYVNTRPELQNTSIADLAQKANSPAMQGLFSQGITPNQIINNPDAQINKYVENLQSGAYGDNIPPEVQALINNGTLIHNDESTGNGGWAAPSAAMPTGLTPDYLFNQGLQKDPQQIGFSPQTGVVTSSQNLRANNTLSELGYFGIPSLLWGGMMGAALGAGGAGELANAGGAGGGSLFSPSTLFKLPSIAQSAGDGQGAGGTLASLAGALLPGAAGAAGLPSYTSTLANLAISLARGGSPLFALPGLLSRLSPNTGGP